MNLIMIIVDININKATERVVALGGCWVSVGGDLFDVVLLFVHRGNGEGLRQY